MTTHIYSFLLPSIYAHHPPPPSFTGSTSVGVPLYRLHRAPFVSRTSTIMSTVFPPLSFLLLVVSQRRHTVEEMRAYLHQLGLLEALDELAVIHITGTKGKGSTCAFVESILRVQGFKTGRCTWT